ncbi:hypothetical protein [Arcanobacterium phocae]|uniref:hypothetical protein n=1 Tax=Arcanobacterium phocae TaxID=131112 RepID=UPI001C0E9445|nr:hypothetical protein [Arcanobacterium phocae]
MKRHTQIFTTLTTALALGFVGSGISNASQVKGETSGDMNGIAEAMDRIESYDDSKVIESIVSPGGGLSVIFLWVGV